MRMDLHSLKPVTVSAGEIAERGSFVDLRNVRNPRTDRKYGCISANVWTFRVKFGGKPRMVCAQGPPELHVFLLDKLARYWSQQRRKSLERKTRSMERKKFRKSEGLPTETNSPNRGFRTGREVTKKGGDSVWPEFVALSYNNKSTGVAPASSKSQTRPV